MDLTTEKLQDDDIWYNFRSDTKCCLNCNSYGKECFGINKESGELEDSYCENFKKVVLR